MMLPVVAVLSALSGFTTLALVVFLVTGEISPLAAMIFMWSGILPAVVAGWWYLRRERIRRGRGL